MKTTESKSLEAYIYSNVILPLKKLATDLDCPSPLLSAEGEKLTLSWEKSSPDGRFQRNYQRRRAESKSPQLLVVTGTFTREVLASYDGQHRVTIYKKPFKELKATQLMSRLYDAFYTNTPFTTVKVIPQKPQTIRDDFEDDGEDMPF